MSSSTSKQLQNNIVDLFCSQQKSLTSANRKMQYMFSSLDALMLNSHANAHNDKNTINLQNVNSQQKEQTWAIVKFKEIKKQKAMKSSQKEARIKVSTSKCYDVISKKMQIKRLRERIEFAVNQLRQALSEQKETINYSLTYIQRACNESIENSIQKQIDWLQSQTNNKLKIILQLIQQNAENIKKKINAKQMTKNSQILQKMQSSQTLQVMQNSQKLTQKLTYAQKAAQDTDANANVNANADEWNLIIKKFSSKLQEISYRERRLIVNLKNENWTLKMIFFYFFIKCMQSMTMTLSRRCAYVRLHVSWSKSLLYIFSLINHIDSLHKQVLSIKQLLSFVLSFSRFFVFFSLYSFVFNSHFLVAIQVLFKYFSIAILSILMINNINIVFMFLNCAFALSCNCSAL